MEPYTAPYEFETPVSIADGWFFECSGQIHYGGYGTNKLWLWYANDVEPADMMPEGIAWPWLKGQYLAEGSPALEDGLIPNRPTRAGLDIALAETPPTGFRVRLL
jgi:hypothetical protein